MKTVKNDLRTYDNIQKIATGQGDDYTTGCLLDYLYFKNYYEMIAIDVSKQQDLEAGRKAIKNIVLEIQIEMKNNNVFHVEEAKETISDFSQGTVKGL